LQKGAIEFKADPQKGQLFLTFDANLGFIVFKKYKVIRKAGFVFGFRTD